MGRLREMAEYYQEKRSAVAGPFTTLEDFRNLPLWEDFLRKFNVELEMKLILEVGCGGGHIGRYCQEHGGHYVGIDIAPVSIDKAREVVRAPILRADGQGLPFRKDVFDLIICLDTFEHFEDQGAAALEFRRVLKGGGVLLLSVPNYSNLAGLVKWAQERFGFYARNTFDAISWDRQVVEHFVTPGRVTRIFRVNGFTEFSVLGGEAALLLGLFPWHHWPKIPRQMRYLLGGGLKTLLPMGLINRLFPGLSVRNFWRIS